MSDSIFYEVLFDFNAEDEGELSVYVGELVKGTDGEAEEGWLFVTSSDGASGFVPLDYVKEIDPVGNPRFAVDWAAQLQDQGIAAGPSAANNTSSSSDGASPQNSAPHSDIGSDHGQQDNSDDEQHATSSSVSAVATASTSSPREPEQAPRPQTQGQGQGQEQSQAKLSTASISSTAAHALGSTWTPPAAAQSPAAVRSGGTGGGTIFASPGAYRQQSGGNNGNIGLGSKYSTASGARPSATPSSASVGSVAGGSLGSSTYSTAPPGASASKSSVFAKAANRSVGGGSVSSGVLSKSVAPPRPPALVAAVERENLESLLRKNQEYFAKVTASQADALDSVTEMVDGLTRRLGDAAATSADFVGKLNELDAIIDEEKRKWKTLMESERSASISERNRELIAQGTVPSANAADSAASSRN